MKPSGPKGPKFFFWGGGGSRPRNFLHDHIHGREWVENASANINFEKKKLSSYLRNRTDTKSAIQFGTRSVVTRSNRASLLKRCVSYIASSVQSTHTSIGMPASIFIVSLVDGQVLRYVERFSVGFHTERYSCPIFTQERFVFCYAKPSYLSEPNDCSFDELDCELDKWLNSTCFTR